MNDSTITCDEIIDAKAKSNDEETNQFQEILIKKYNMQNKISIFHLPFY